MANSKATKKALFMSMLSLLLCFTMLMGATFAWFTDTVTSKNNRIVAGNLDVDLVMYKEAEGKYVSIAGGSGDIFSELEGGQGFNWEPGKTEIVYLGVRNNGSLALKYNILLDIVSEAIGTDKKPLADALEYAIIDGTEYEANKYADWNAVKAAAEASGDQAATGNLLIGKGIVTAQNGVLDKIATPPYSEENKGETDYFALAVHMKEDAGNEYQNGEVSIDVTVFATQKDAEEDSFGPEYDEPAPMGHPISNEVELIEALEAGLDNLVITEDFMVSDTITIPDNITINGGGHIISRAGGISLMTLAADEPEFYTGVMFTVAEGKTLELEDVIIDGGATWTGEVNETLQRGTVNSGIIAKGALVNVGKNATVVLGKGAVLQNNAGANAVNLGTRTGGKLIVDGGEIINNYSAAGAIWGGGEIVLNSGKINNNHGGIGGAIRVVTNIGTVLTMNGGEMNHNLSDDVGGAIWAGTSRSNNVYVLNGGEMAYNYSPKTGGAIYAGYYETVKIGGDFKMHDNASAADIGDAIRFHDHASFVMTGGEIYDNGDNSLFLLNNSASITGGKISDNFGYGGGLGLTIGAADIDGVIAYDLSTNHNTAYLAADFNDFKFTVNEADEHFANFNFKPADGYNYTEGDEAKLVCMNEGYSTYWDAASGTFKLQANQ